MSFGLEHGNEEFRREKLLRNMTNDFILSQAQIVAKLEVPYSLNIIIGLPYETRELYFNTIQLIRKIGKFDSLAANIFAPYRGTKMREMALKEGWLDPMKPATSFIAESILEMPQPYLQPDEMLGLSTLLCPRRDLLKLNSQRSLISKVTKYSKSCPKNFIYTNMGQMKQIE